MWTSALGLLVVGFGVMPARAVLPRVSLQGDRMDIFVPSTRYPCFRQPAIAATGLDRLTLLAFAENRNITSCAPSRQHSRLGPLAKEQRGSSASPTGVDTVEHPDEVGSLQMRRSVDGGKTFSALQMMAVGNLDYYAVTAAPDGKSVPSSFPIPLTCGTHA
jgi:hypothetical protein